MRYRIVETTTGRVPEARDVRLIPAADGVMLQIKDIASGSWFSVLELQSAGTIKRIGYLSGNLGLALSVDKKATIT